MMKRVLTILCTLAALLCPMGMMAHSQYVSVDTRGVSLIFGVGDNGRLYQSYLGQRLTHQADYAALPGGIEAYLTHGMEDYFEPALDIRHSDGNPSTLLKYVSHQVSTNADGSHRTVFTLADDKYPVTVRLIFDAYHDQDIIVAHSEIVNGERRAVAQPICADRVQWRLGQRGGHDRD